MDNNRAVEILQMLLDGIHPMTGEILPDDHVCLENDVAVAIYCGVEALRKAPEQKKIPEHSKPMKPNAGRPWTEEEDACLIELYSKGASTEEMCEKLTRREFGIRKRLTELIPPPENERAPVRPGLENAGKPWSPKDDERLKQMFKQNMSADEMAKVLRRTPRGIAYRLERFRLVDDAEGYLVSPLASKRTDNDDLRERFLHGETISQLAGRYQQSEKSIRARLFYMGFGGSGPKLLPDRGRDDE